MLMLLVVPLVAITGFPQWIPHFSALAFDDDDDDDDDLPWPSQSFLVFFKITKTKSDKKVKNLNHGC